jgi:hypothetical protein
MCLKCGQNNGFVLRDTLRALLPLSCDEMLLAEGLKPPFTAQSNAHFSHDRQNFSPLPTTLLNEMEREGELYGKRERERIILTAIQPQTHSLTKLKSPRRYKWMRLPQVSHKNAANQQ